MTAKNTITNRLAYAVKAKREALGLTQTALAKITGYSAANQSRFEKGLQRPSDEIVERIADVLDTTIADLYRAADSIGLMGDNIAPTPDIANMIPLIGYAAAGNFTHVRELPPHEIKKWYPTMKKLKGKGFALQIIGDSMTSPTGKSYPDGTICIFDADDRDPPTGALVLAKLQDEDEITFKKLVIDAGRPMLTSLNTTYPAITKPFQILATLKSAIIE